MLANVKRFGFSLLIILICFHIFQLLYHNYDWEMIQARMQQGYKGNNNMQNDSVKDGKHITHVDNIRRVLDEGINNLSNKKQTNSSSITSTSTATTRTTHNTEAQLRSNAIKNARPHHVHPAENERIITYSAQANIVQHVVKWRNAQVERDTLEKQRALTYDGHDLLQDVSTLLTISLIASKINFTNSFRRWTEGYI